MKLYQSFIVPHFNYCAETWNFCSKGATTKLEKLNERALRFVYRDYSSSYEMLLKQSGYQTLLNQRLAKILTTVYKVVNGQGVSESLCDLVELRESNYNLRGDKILTLPKVNTTKYGLSLFRRGSRVVQEFVISIRCAKCTAGAKSNGSIRRRTSARCVSISHTSLSFSRTSMDFSTLAKFDSLKLTETHG